MQRPSNEDSVNLYAETTAVVIGGGDGLSYSGEGGGGFVLPYFVYKGASWRVRFRMVGCLLSLVSWWRGCGGVSVVVEEEEDRTVF